MEFKGSELSIVQNFVVKSQGRLNIFDESVKRFSKVLKNYPFLVNYDTKENYNKVRSTYNLLNKVYFQQGENKNWAEDTLSLIEKTDSPYIGYLMEDSLFDKNFTTKSFTEMFNEFKQNDCAHLLMGKVGKYQKDKWYNSPNTKLKHIRVFDCSTCPYHHKVMSLVAIWERELFINCLRNTNKDKGLKGMDNFERNNSFTTGYNIACPHYACIDHIETLDGIEYKER